MLPQSNNRNFRIVQKRRVHHPVGQRQQRDFINDNYQILRRNDQQQQQVQAYRFPSRNFIQIYQRPHQIRQPQERNHNNRNFRVQQRRNIVIRPLISLQALNQNALNFQNGLNNALVSIRQVMNDIINIREELINSQPQNQSNGNSQRLTKQQLDMLPIANHTGQQTPCSICLQSIQKQQQIIYLVCFHFYHIQCGKKWLEKSIICPMCKVNIRQHLHEGHEHH